MTNEIEDLKGKLLKGEFSSFSVACNDHKLSYQTAAEAIERDPWYDEGDFISHEELKRSVSTNTIWTLQYYPETPVGFVKLHASAFQPLLDRINQEDR